MDNLSIGDKALFAIRLETDRHFASVSIFFESEEMGNNDEYTQLYTFTSLLESKVNNYNYIFANEINHLDKDTIYLYVVDGFEKTESWRESQRLESIWITLNLTPCFDGETLILLSTDEYDRVIWKKFNSETIRETFLPAGY
ncbi:Imm42 family immunity protein, partial [Citrobacter portucalensis]